MRIGRTPFSITDQDEVVYGIDTLDFRASGASKLDISSLGGGSGRVTIHSKRGVDIGGSGGVPTYLDRSYVEFVGSGGGLVGLEDMGGGSGRVVVSASGAQGPQGAQGTPGAQGAQGTPGDGTIFRVVGSAACRSRARCATSSSRRPAAPRSG